MKILVESVVVGEWGEN